MISNQKQHNVDIVLLHHPVLGRKGEIIGSAVTNLDLHDIARTARTYGIGNYYIVTPYVDQQKLVEEILEHWRGGHGSTYNPARKEAFSLVRLAKSLDEVLDVIARNQSPPVLVTTSAKTQAGNITYEASCARIAGGEQTLLVFGTAHGLAPGITARADYTLPPITGPTDYNHLSVRAAVAIICDRLLR